MFPGTYAVRPATVRAVFMDLATELGDQGFRWIFVVHGHGSPAHNGIAHPGRRPLRGALGEVGHPSAYHQAQEDRKAGRAQAAASLIAEAASRFPGDAGVQMLVAESALRDRKDPAAALALLGSLSVPQDDVRSRIRQGMLIADAHEAAGRPDAARAALQQLLAAFPENRRIRQRLEGPPPAAPVK